MSRARLTRRARRLTLPALSLPTLPALPLPVRFWVGMLARPLAAIALGGVAATLAPSLLPQADAVLLSVLRVVLSLIGGVR